MEKATLVCELFMEILVRIAVWGRGQPPDVSAGSDARRPAPWVCQFMRAPGAEWPCPRRGGSTGDSMDTSLGGSGECSVAHSADHARIDKPSFPSRGPSPKNTCRGRWTCAAVATSVSPSWRTLPTGILRSDNFSATCLFGPFPIHFSVKWRKY